MARDVDGLAPVLSDGFSRYLSVDILHGTDVVESGVYVENWSLTSDLSRDPKTTGSLRIVHASVKGESWVPKGATGLLSPFRATLLLTEVISVGSFERRVQLGLFDVVAVPASSDTTATVGARWVEETETVGDLFPEAFPLDDTFPGGITYGGGYLTGGYEAVMASIIEVEIESIDGRVLGASFRNSRPALETAWAEWRAIGMLPVLGNTDDVELPARAWPAEKGSRLDAVQSAARALGGVPVVDSAGQWRLADDETPTVLLDVGERGTVVDLSSELTLDDFANVVVGEYEDDQGNGIRVEWTAPGALSPEEMGREIVAFHKSDDVHNVDQARAAVAAEGARLTSQEVDVLITCVYNPTVELGDHVTVPGEIERGKAVRVNISDAPTMQVTARIRRQL